MKHNTAPKDWLQRSKTQRARAGSTTRGRMGLYMQGCQCLIAIETARLLAGPEPDSAYWAWGQKPPSDRCPLYLSACKSSKTRGTKARIVYLACACSYQLPFWVYFRICSASILLISNLQRELTAAGCVYIQPGVKRKCNYVPSALFDEQS